MSIELSDEVSDPWTEKSIETALRLFRDRGYDNTPMSLVAKELKLTKPGVYHHFASKEILLYRVHRYTIDKYFLPVLEEVERVADPMERLKAFISGYSKAITRDPWAGVMIREARRLDPEHRDEIYRLWRRPLDLVRGAIIELQEQGRCRLDINATFAAFGAIGMCSWTVNWFDYSRPESADALAETLLSIFINGIVGPSMPG